MDSVMESQAWRAALEDARAILDNCSVAVHFVDADGVIIYANQAELDCMGYTREEYIGRNITEFHVSQDTITDIFDRLKKGLTLLNYEAEVRCKNGSTRVVQINSNVYWGANGEFVHTRCFTRDITELKKAQLRLLEEQRMRLKEADEYKHNTNNFIDMLCHELRNPLNGVLGLLVCMREEINGLQQALRDRDYAAADERAEASMLMLDHIDECAQHQRTIMDDVLNLSRLEAKESYDPTAEETVFDPRGTIDSVLRMYTGVIQLKRLQVSVDTDELGGGHVGPMVMADENRFKQILINLLSNAVKFSKNQGSINVSLRRSTDPINGLTYLEGCIRDTGIGISEQDQGTLFAPFSAQKRKRVLKYGGSGLGLRITSQLLDLMHGSISVKSSPGEGTAVTFKLQCTPATVTQTAAAQQGTLSGKLDEPESFSTDQIPELIERTDAALSDRTPRILVCEDNLINQKVLSRFMKIRSIEHIVAGSGEDAVEMYRDSLDKGPLIDLIFMDIELPGMNGIEATAQIRKMEKEAGGDRRVPVVCMSGYTRSEYKLMAFGVGMNDYISKPFSKDKVFGLIDAYVARKGS